MDTETAYNHGLTTDREKFELLAKIEKLQKKVAELEERVERLEGPSQEDPAIVDTEPVECSCGWKGAHAEGLEHWNHVEGRGSFRALKCPRCKSEYWSELDGE